MGVYVSLTCCGCTAAVSGLRLGIIHDELPRRHAAGMEWVSERRQTVEEVAPDGWMPFDPYTNATYCPDCWASIVGGDSGADPEPQS